MTKKTKTILILLLIVLIVGAVLAYYLLVKGELPQIIKETPTQDQGTTTQIKPAPEGKLKQLTQKEVVSPAISEEKNTIKYIIKDGGNLYQTDLNGENSQEIKFVPLSGLIKTLWSKDQQKFINIYQDQFGTKRFFYDIAAQHTAPLNTSITWLDYSKDQDKIAYHYLDPTSGLNSIATANPDGTFAKTIVNTRLRDVRLSWVSEDKIVVSTAPSGISPNILYSVDLNKPKFEKILDNIYGMTSLWAQNGSMFLFSQTNDKGGDLKLMSSNASGLNIQNTGLKTLPEKCVFSDDSINVYCAEPQNIPDSAIMPDDYYKRTLSLNDKIWKINLRTNKKDLLYEFNVGKDFDVGDMYVTKDGKYIYFINRNEGFLYRLEL